MEVSKPAAAPDYVEMAQGDWAELLVHSDRVQKASDVYVVMYMYQYVSQQLLSDQIHTPRYCFQLNCVFMPTAVVSGEHFTSFDG